MNYLYIVKPFLMVLPLAVTSLWAASNEDQQLIQQLRQLSLFDLGKVEIRLDDTFDVFNSLVRNKQTTIATGESQLIDQAPSVTTIITAQDIEAMGARTLEEVLQSVPGLQVSYNWYDVPVYSIRGISMELDSQNLFLINGIRINDSVTGGKGLYWAGFPLSIISRIEIIRGPGSAVYGADAFAGVINVITKTADEIDGTEVGVRWGTQDTKDVWVLNGYEWNDFKIAFMAEFNHTDGHQRIVEADAQTAFDNTFGTYSSLAPNHYGSEMTAYDARVDIQKQHWQLRAGINRSYDVGAGVGVAQALDLTKPLYSDRTNLDITYHNPDFTDDWELETQLSYLDGGFGAKLYLFPPFAVGNSAYPKGFIGQPSGSERQILFNLSGFYRGIENHAIRLGMGYGFYDLYKVTESKNFGLNPFTGQPIDPLQVIDVSDTVAAFLPEKSRHNTYVFVQDTWHIDEQWALTTGLRYDRYSDFGSTINPRLGLVWSVNYDTTIKLLYGQAFRAPSMQELYNHNNPVNLGNPDIKPETIETWELAFDHRATEYLNLSLNLFSYQIEDKIIFVPNSESQIQSANASSWYGKGLEFETRWKMSSKSSLLFNYSFQESEDHVTDLTLPTTPHQTAFLRADYLLIPKWYADMQINWNDGWARASNDLRDNLEGYTTMDLMLRRKDAHTNIALGIRNLFDSDVRYPSPAPDIGSVEANIPYDLPSGKRFYFIELRYYFK